jgi:hypothetical protein
VFIAKSFFLGYFVFRRPDVVLHKQAAALDVRASGEHIERSYAYERKAELLKRF